jgi:thiamine-phosphate pyrophosphorylase
VIITVLSPEGDDPREGVVLAALFSAGLERYHVRKPVWSAVRLEAWLRAIPVEWYPRLVLHQHHHLVTTLGLGGRHWRDMPGDAGASAAVAPGDGQAGYGVLTSRSCHDLATLRASLERYDSIFFGPVFPSVSKPGYGPKGNIPPHELTSLFAGRTDAQRRATVLALGGITAETAAQAIALGFDGVAVLGAVWQSGDPVCTFTAIRESVRAAPVGNIRSDHAA